MVASSREQLHLLICEVLSMTARAGKCGVAGMTNAQLRGIIDAHYRTPAALDEWSRYRLFPEERYLMDRYYRANELVLDHACGAGRTTLLLHERGMRVVGVDISSVALQHARRRFPYLHF